MSNPVCYIKDGSKIYEVIDGQAKEAVLSVEEADKFTRIFGSKISPQIAQENKIKAFTMHGETFLKFNGHTFSLSNASNDDLKIILELLSAPQNKIFQDVVETANRISALIKQRKN